MDYTAAIQSGYASLDADNVGNAVNTCLRIARHLQDHMNAAAFLREYYPGNREFIRVLYDDTSHLSRDAQKYLYDKSLDCFLETRKLDFSLGTTEDGEELTILSAGIGEFDSEIDQLERMITDLAVPSGMCEYDTAYFTEKNANAKARIRLKIRAMNTVKQRVKTRCLNYLIQIERQLNAQKKPVSFLERCQNGVNNYFHHHSDDVYQKLLKAAELVESTSKEDCSLLLTQVRRAIKAVADYFYPASTEPVVCTDGTERTLGEEQYLNRLYEYLQRTFAKSSSRDLLRAELDHLGGFVRRLNDVASKGVHSDVGVQEGQQGLLGLYMFLHNVIARLEVGEAATDSQRPD